MWYVGITSLVVLSLLAVAFAALDIGPKVGFLARARRCRARLLATRMENGLDLGSKRSIFHVELVTPPELAGTRLVATYRPAPGIGQEYFFGGNAGREAGDFRVGSEYDCWIDPTRLDRAAMNPRPSWVLGGTAGALGLAGLALAVLLLTGTVTVTVTDAAR